METKLFVCCHRPSFVPKQELLVPIQVGAALAERRMEGFVQDDTGENISALNRSYCELTAQYWAWKNCRADYVGFFHYRRYLYPDPAAKRPYVIRSLPSEALLNELGYEDFGELIGQYELIAPKGEDMLVSVREHYAASPHHRAKDLALAEEILRERCPDDAEAAERYLSGSVQYFGNIFIMRRAVFEDYCAWLFPLLAEFDRRADTTGYSAQEKRVDGYLAERLLGIYFTRSRDKLKTLELPRVHFDGEEPLKSRVRKRLLYRLCPPGSKWRAIVKRWNTKRLP